MAGASDWILPIVLLGAGYYEFVIRNGQDIQNLLGSAQGVGGGGGSTPCMGKDSTGAACPCTTSSVAYSYPVYSYRSSRKKKSSSKKGGGASKGGGGGGYGSSGGGSSSSAPASTSTSGSCDCSACTGGSTGTTAGGNTWVQDPAFNAKTLPCPTLGQPCSPAGARGGTSGPNKWCLCGGATGKKTTSKTGGAATVEGFAGAAIAHEAWGLPAVLY